MNCIPVATYGLCEGFQRGDKCKIREEVDTATHFFEEGADVTILDFTEKRRPPQCKNDKARLLIFKDSESYWHPMWIINCKVCPFDDHSNVDRCESCK